MIVHSLSCGDPREGFAHIYCDACRHEYLLAYSCKTRYFCPSCHQKRVLLYGEWVKTICSADRCRRTSSRRFCERLDAE